MKMKCTRKSNLIYLFGAAKAKSDAKWEQNLKQFNFPNAKREWRPLFHSRSLSDFLLVSLFLTLSVYSRIFHFLPRSLFSSGSNWVSIWRLALTQIALPQSLSPFNPLPFPLGFPLPAQSFAHKRNSFTDFLLKAFFELSWLGHLNLQCPAAFPPLSLFPLFSLFFNCHFYQQLFSFHFPSLPFSLFRCGGCHILFIVVVVGQTMTTYSWPEKGNILFWATSSCRNKRRHIKLDLARRAST